MLHVVGFILSLILVAYSSFKLWKDRDEHTAKGRLWFELVVLAIGLAGAVISLLNGIAGSQKVTALQQSLDATQNYVVAAEEGRNPRSLTRAQQQQMLQDLQAIPPQTIAFYWDASSVESKRFALQVFYPFQQAKWSLAASGNKFGVPDYPIYIGYASGEEAIANTVQKAFEDAGITPHVEALPATNLKIALEIDVGDRP